MFTGLGGGITRDILLDALPPATFLDWRYLALAAAGGLIAFVLSRRLERLALPITLLDAVGLGVFAVLGAEKTLNMGFGVIRAIIVGTITAVGGGAIRDMMNRTDSHRAAERALRHPSLGRMHRGRDPAGLSGHAGRAGRGDGLLWDPHDRRAVRPRRAATAWTPLTVSPVGDGISAAPSQVRPRRLSHCLTCSRRQHLLIAVVRGGKRRISTLSQSRARLWD